MKTSSFLVFTLIGCSLVTLSAQDGTSILLPSSRKVTEVTESERNPFAKVEEPKPETPVIATDAKSEESRIEAVLGGLKIVGRTRGPNGWKVLLGDLILETGKTLPPVIEGQTQTLRVAAIYDSMIEIEWVNKDSRELPKRIFVAIQLKPTVGSALGGRQAVPGGKAPPVVITRPQEDQKLATDALAPGR